MGRAMSANVLRRAGRREALSHSPWVASFMVVFKTASSETNGSLNRTTTSRNQEPMECSLSRTNKHRRTPTASTSASWRWWVLQAAKVLLFPGHALPLKTDLPASLADECGGEPHPRIVTGVVALDGAQKISEHVAGLDSIATTLVAPAINGRTSKRDDGFQDAEGRR